jgi:hypothetical protein
MMLARVNAGCAEVHPPAIGTGVKGVVLPALYKMGE